MKKKLLILDSSPFNKDINHAEGQVTFLYVGWMVEKKGIKELINVILENRALDKFSFILKSNSTNVEAILESIIDDKKYLIYLRSKVCVEL